MTKILLIFSVFFNVYAQASEGGHDQLFPRAQPELQNSALPAKVELLEPAYHTSVSSPVTLKWKESEGAENYHVQVATDPNFKWLVVDEHMYKGTSYDFKNAEAGKRYHWRVAGTNQAKWAGSTKGFYGSSSFNTK